MPAFGYSQDDYYALRQTSTDLVYPTEWWREDGRWRMAIHGPEWMLKDIQRELGRNITITTELQDTKTKLIVTFAYREADGAK